MKTITLTAFATMLPLAAFAHDGMHVNDIYARSANPMTGAVFMQLENHRDVMCTLQGVSSDVAERVELHTHTEEDGVMKMGKIEGGIDIPPHEAHMLKRGSDHVMLLGLTRPLKDGDTFDLTLDFGDCGSETVSAVLDNERTDGHGAEDGGTSADEHADH
ncbi:copper chaperone PCu(A)C [Paracoccus sp. JM45]|uniref:copper chaperone PCu(A)C n=1 Tax=Paracoccus sp. JM45 TaxID=2283626 RepID=UPI000E6BEF8A|nr:copper chaperone PCu(A)C [Paracoccus sp. JM45]RJE80540.1 copper chaperone PCu(A)C [Paracoccus sp. JM45]